VKISIFRHILKMSTDTLKQEYLPKYSTDGEQKFYRYLLVSALNKLVLIDTGIYKGITPELEFLDYHAQFMILYRREGDEIYLQIARLLRKAAHKIYRVMLKKNMTNLNINFLNSV
jgi:hypothetical protein